MAYELAPVIRQRYFDSNGAPLAGGFLYTYIAGSATPLGTFQDSLGSTPNTNPIVLDADGYIPNSLYVNLGAGAYKFVLADSSDNILWTQDNIQGSSVTATSSGWTTHSITNGQAATDLAAETLNVTLYSSALYDYEILRGTTVLSNGSLAIQVVNGTARVNDGVYIGSEDHGVTFTVSQAAGVAQLRAACSSGPGNGTIKFSRRLVPA